MNALTTIKRSELYQLVWQEPMVRLAKTYGLSDVGLAKICRKHNIPRPPRGYWARKQHGHNPRQIPLPEPDQDGEIELRDPDELANSPADSNDEVAVKVAEEQNRAPIEVADSLRGAHDLVSRANQELKTARTNDQGLIVCPDSSPLDVCVSKASLRRALLLLDALLKALEVRGYEVAAGPAVTILGATVRFSISEELETKRDECEEDDLEGHYSFHHSRFHESRVPSGRLALKIDAGGRYWSSGCRHTWRDTAKQPLEGRLNKFIVGLVKMAGRIKEQEEQERRQEKIRQQEAARRREQERVLAEKRDRYKAEKARFDLLLTQGENWRKSKLVRELIEAAREAHSAAGPIEPDSKIGQWIDWASQQADRLDPLQVGPPSILDEKSEEIEEPRRGFRTTW